MGEDIHPPDTGNLEEAVLPLLDVVGPHVDVVVREAEGLHKAVPDLSGIGGGVAPQKNLFVVIHGVPESLDAGGVRLAALELVDAGEVIHDSELPVQRGFQGIGAVEVLNEAAHDLGFLVREVDHLVEVFHG